ncbi:MAG TPA: serine hydrolase domain-containing protein [Thermomicrobiales bacterium]|nr:serine hydrolase domain-containing protein [Thermomicrobiales bacterium]
MAPLPPESKLISTADSLLEETETPGAAVAILVDGERVFHAGVGSLDLARGKAIEVDAQFLLYSVTKMLLAAVTMRLVERGIVSLTDSVASLIPEAAIDRRMSLRHLLRHTSGLRDYGGMPEYHEAVRTSPMEPWPEATILGRTLAQGALFEPGQGWAYSNIGYLLIRRVVGRHAGGSLATALDELLFRPLGLERTRMCETLDDTLELTPGFTTSIGEGGLVDVRGRYHPGWVAHGVVQSTVAELAVVVDALLAGHLLGQQSLAVMRAALPVLVTHPVIRVPGYGLGLMMDLDPGSHSLTGHAGGGPGYSAAAFSIRSGDGRRITIATLANRDADEVALRMVVELGGMLAGTS